jgi:hypothetical protein
VIASRMASCDVTVALVILFLMFSKSEPLLQVMNNDL